MAERNNTYRIFISAAEPSADAHCAALITSLQQTAYNIEFVGVGGPKMAAAGCELLEVTIGRAAMIYNAFTQAAHFYKLLRRISRFFKSNKVDLVIVCDSPAFNFHVAKAAKKANIKTLFYVAPQLWAWARWRISKLTKRCDKLCCILPFEQDWFRQRGVDATFVGNPLLDKMDGRFENFRKKYADFDPKKAKIAIMPGSRTAEINTLWKPMQEIANRIKQKYPDVEFTAVAVDEERENALKSTRIAGFLCKYTIGMVMETASNADFAIVASGSATLEVAAVGCPMVVMYQSSRILWHLVGRFIIKTKYLSLVNILADKELVPEYMPYFSSIEPIVQEIEKSLADSEKLSKISDELIKLTQPLGKGKVADKVALAVTEML